METNISYFTNFTASPKTISLDEFCLGVISGYWKEQVLAVRNSANKAEAKKQLPGVTISGVFNGWRRTENLVEHSGFLCVDIDRRENEAITDWDDLKREIGKTAYFVAYSASGYGLFAIYRYNPSMYDIKEVFTYVQQYFYSTGIVIDPACSDITRLRFVSYDPEAIYHPDGGYLMISNQEEGYYKSKGRYAKEMLQKKSKATEKPSNSKEEKGLTLDALAKWTEKKVGVFTQGRRNIFIFSLAAAAHRCGIDYNDTLSYCLSYAEEGFTRDEIERTVRSVYNNESYRGVGEREGISTLNKERIKPPRPSLNPTPTPKPVRVAQYEEALSPSYLTPQREHLLTERGIMRTEEQKIEPYLPKKIEGERNDTLKEPIKKREEGVLVTPPNYFMESPLVQSVKSFSDKWFEPKEKEEVYPVQWIQPPDPYRVRTPHSEGFSLDAPKGEVPF